MSSVLRDLGAIAFGLLFVVIGAVLFGPTPWSAARLLRKGRRVTATVVDARACGISRGSAGPGGYIIDRPYPPAVRLAFRLDGRHMERTLRLAEPAAQTGYQAGQELEIYVGGRLRTRIRSQSEANEHGDFERVLGICLAFAGLFWIVYSIIIGVTGRVF
jgi:hypothetical protein